MAKKTAKKKYADPSPDFVEKKMIRPHNQTGRYAIPGLDYEGRPGAKMRRLLIDINLEEEAGKRDEKRRRRNDNREAPRNTTGPRG